MINCQLLWRHKQVLSMNITSNQKLYEDFVASAYFFLAMIICFGLSILNYRTYQLLIAVFEKKNDSVIIPKCTTYVEYSSPKD